MSPVAEIRFIAARELQRSIRSAKGIAVGALTLLGAFVTALVCAKLEQKIRDAIPADALTADALLEAKRASLLQLSGDPTLADFLAPTPTSLLIFLRVTIWFSPLLVALLGFDAISGELQHREVRFWTVRSRRASYFLAKFLGLWVLVGLVTLALNGIAGGVVLGRGFVTAPALAAWGLRFWLVAFAIAAPWAAIATLVSSGMKSPILALLTTFGVFFVMWIGGMVGTFAHQQRVADAMKAGARPASDLVFYEYLYPNAYDSLLLSGDAVKTWMGVGLLALFTGLVVTLGVVLFQRRDV